MAAKKEEAQTAEKQIGKMILFNNTQRPFALKAGTGGERRVFASGSSMEFTDEDEYNMLKRYPGVSTTLQVSPDLGRYVVQLESEKKALQDEIATLKEQLGKKKG